MDSSVTGSKNIL